MEKLRLESEIREVEGVKVLALSGEIDVYTAPQFKDAVSEILASGQLHLIVDMSKVNYMDSSGFGTLLSATKKLRPQNGSVNLVGCTPAIERILHITKLDTVFVTCSNLNDCLASIK